MADAKISALSTATTLAGSETIPAVQGGATVKVTASKLVSDSILGAANKAAILDADLFGIVDVAGGNVLKDHSFANLKAAMVFPVVIHCRVSATYTTAVAASTNQFRYRLPAAMTLTSIVGTLVTAQATGGLLTVDVHEAGTTVMATTKLTFDNTETTTTTAATPAVISDSALASGAEITIDVDSIGDGTAQGLDVYLIGTRVA